MPEVGQTEEDGGLEELRGGQEDPLEHGGVRGLGGFRAFGVY